MPYGRNHFIQARPGAPRVGVRLAITRAYSVWYAGAEVYYNGLNSNYIHYTASRMSDKSDVDTVSFSRSACIECMVSNLIRLIYRLPRRLYRATLQGATGRKVQHLAVR